MRKSIYLLILLLIIFISASCESKDGDEWENMKWKTDTKIEKGVINVSAQGGTFIFKCTNYGYLFLSLVVEEKKEIQVKCDNICSANGEWCDIITEMNTLIVTIAPNNNKIDRILEVEVCPGSISDFFIFKQTRE